MNVSGATILTSTEEDAANLASGRAGDRLIGAAVGATSGDLFLPRFTTDLNAAMLLVDTVQARAQERGQRIEFRLVCLRPTGSDLPAWSSTFRLTWPGQGQRPAVAAWLYADTPSLAVCRAFLLLQARLKAPESQSSAAPPR
jgi:hypothetical protein